MIWDKIKPNREYLPVRKKTYAILDIRRTGRRWLTWTEYLIEVNGEQKRIEKKYFIIKK